MKKHLVTLILFTALILGSCFYIVWDAFIRASEPEKELNLPEITLLEIDTTHSVNAEGMSQSRGNGSAVSTEPMTLEQAQEEIRSYAAINGLSTEYYPDDLVEKMVNNPELKDFVLGYPLGNSNAQPDDISITRDLTIANGGIPFFLQWDERWGYTTYGSDLMGFTGCGPTALSMVAVYLTGDSSLNPLYVAEYAMENGYYDYESSSGTYWSLMTSGAQGLGLAATEVPGEEASLISALETGHPVICIMGPGDFTSEGHFIVLTGYSNGYVTVNDPNSISKSELVWPIETILDQANCIWEYSYYG